VKLNQEEIALNQFNDLIDKQFKMMDISEEVKLILKINIIEDCLKVYPLEI